MVPWYGACSYNFCRKLSSLFRQWIFACISIVQVVTPAQGYKADLVDPEILVDRSFVPHG
jgi:hypothetical protein